MRYAVITGVSSGIGRATALKFLQEGFCVFGTIRKKTDADSLKQDYPTTFYPLVCDITNFKEVNKALKEVVKVVGDEGLDVLVNNAGVAMYGPMQCVKIEDLRTQFEINVFSTVNFTQKFLPLLGATKTAKKKGKLFVISSAAGIMTRPMLGPYSSSKHAIEAIFDAFRRELMLYGMQVVIIEPGPIKTDIWNKAKDKENPYADTDYKEIFDELNNAVDDIESNALPVEKVSNKIWEAYKSSNPKARYLIAPKKLQFLLAMYVLPAKRLDKIFYKQIKKLTK